MPLSNSGLGSINISLPPNVASTVTLEPVEGLAAGNVQAGIAELATKRLAKSENLSDLENVEAARTNLVAAKSGENTDIVSLGDLNNSVTIKGNLFLPNTSKFKIFTNLDQLFSAGSWHKILFPQIVFDPFNQTTDSRFICAMSGLYSMRLALYFRAITSTGVYIELRVNGIPFSLIAAQQLPPGPHFFNESVDVDFLVNDYAEVFIYCISDSESIASENIGRVFFAGRHVG